MSKVKRNFIYNASYQVLKLFTSFITTPYISRVLGANGRGVYSYAYSIAAYFVMFAMLGVNSYGNRSIAMARENAEELNKKFTGIYCFQMGTSAIMIALYIFYTAFLCGDKVIGWLLLGYVISAGLDINWLFAGLEKFNIIVLRNIGVQILTTAAIFLFVRQRTDVYIYTLINVAGIAASQLIMWASLYKYVRFVKVGWREIIAHAKPNIILFIPLMAVSLYTVMDKVMLGMLSSKTEVGLYEACEGICQIPGAFIFALEGVMLPRMSNLWANKDEEQSARYIDLSILFALFSSTAICFGLMSVAREFVPVYYGSGFEKCIILYQWLLPSNIFVAFANIIRVQFLIPRGYDKVYVSSVCLGAAVNIVLNLLLIPQLQSLGAALGTFAAEMIVCMYQCIAVRHKLPIQRYFIQAVPFLASGLVMYWVLTHIDFPFYAIYSIGIKILLGIVLYFGVLLVGTLIFRKYLFYHTVGKR